MGTRTHSGPPGGLPAIKPDSILDVISGPRLAGASEGTGVRRLPLPYPGAPRLLTLVARSNQAHGPASDSLGL